MVRFRRFLLECYAVLVLSGVVGFMGPFGSYADGDLLSRFGHWSALLVGAYVLVRPIIALFERTARITHLPVDRLSLAGVVVLSFPLTLLWRTVATDALRRLGGFGGVFPFALLCAVTVLLVVWWAERKDADMHYRGAPTSGAQEATGEHAIDLPPQQAGRDDATVFAMPGGSPPAVEADRSTDVAGSVRLHARLPRQFHLPVLALESEDHYVRVHGADQSELLLMRLRDAIAEMDAVAGQQTHRSWWVAREAVKDVVSTGRTYEIVLVDDRRVPVARESVERLRRSGFLPNEARSQSQSDSPV